MAGQLRGWLEERKTPLFWLEYEDYALRVFAGGREEVRDDASHWASILADARRVLDSRVVSVDVTAPHLRAAARDPSWPERVAALGPVAAVVELLAAETPRRLVEDTLAATIHRVGSDVDVVLRVAAPPDLLRHHGATGQTLDFDDLDDVALALTERVRDFAEAAVAGVLIATAEPAAQLAEPLEAIESLVNAVGHYGWLSALRLGHCGVAEVPAAAPAAVDLLLLPDEEPGALATAWGEGRAVGGGLGATTFGAGSGAGAGLDSLPPGALLYGDVPRDGVPEQILAILAAARSASG